MLVSPREIAGALRASLLFASTDATRAHLNCIHVEAVGSALRFVATDGHTLWCCEIPAEDSAEDPAPAHQTPWNMRLEDATKIARSADGRESKINLAKREVDGYAYDSAGDAFARYDVVLPAAFTPGKILPEFAGCYVARCCEAFALYGKGFAPEVPKKGTKWEKEQARIARQAHVAPPIAWRVSGELDPALFFSPKFPNAFAIVMPRRGDGLKGATIVDDFLAKVRTAAPSKAA